ncbi:hypothetical protein [Candidatus Nitrosotenuis sp. DW1]|nr:hypothetical protein [Candidatus Nitrosotenuis sp. DW1]
MNQDDERFVEEFVKKHDKLFEALGLEKKTIYIKTHSLFPI